MTPTNATSVLAENAAAAGPRSTDLVAPVLVLAIGNPSRGDDAVGPLLADRLERARLPGVEVLVEFQLQVEHALDLQGRRRVIFVDACVDGTSPVTLRPVQAAAGFGHTSHALAPEQVLETYRCVLGDGAPPAWLLAIEGKEFELGAGLSASAQAACDRAWPVLLGLCDLAEVGRRR